MKILITLFLYLFSFGTWSSSEPLEPCGESTIESADYNWVKASNIKVRVIFEEIDAVLCVGTNKNNSLKIEYVSYRDTWGLKQAYSYKELSKGTKVLLRDTDINVGIIREGKIMTLKLSEVSVKDNNLQFKIALRFLRNLAKLPTKRDHRELVINMVQSKDGSLQAYHETPKDDFNSLVIKIGATLTIYEVDLKDFEIFRKRIETKKLTKVPQI